MTDKTWHTRVTEAVWDYGEAVFMRTRAIYRGGSTTAEMKKLNRSVERARNKFLDILYEEDE